jgi:hypothetical protein
VDAGFGSQYEEAGALLRTASDGAAVATASAHVVADLAVTRFQAPSWLRAQRTEGDSSALLRPPTVLPEQLNAGQRAVFDAVIAAVAQGRQCTMLLHGTAGTGKSFTINALSTALPAQTVRMAPTGVAAVNIAGRTLHSALCIPVQREYAGLEPLAQDAAAVLRRALTPDCPRGLPPLVIIDEISMVSAQMLHSVNARLQQVMDCDTLPFGGAHVVLVGDFGQVPPVCGTSLATHPDDLPRRGTAAATSKGPSADGAVAVADGCNLLWNAVTTKVRLTQVMRQLSGDEAAWRGALLAYYGIMHPYVLRKLHSLFCDTRL